MIADIIDDTSDVRLITRNVMAVFSTNKEFTDSFILKLKHSSYYVNNNVTDSNKIISYIRKTYNIYENIFRFVSRHKEYSLEKFIEYLNFLDLSHFLWLHFYQLSSQDLSVVEILLQLSSYKPIVIIGYIDDLEYRDKLYSILFNIGLDDRLIIVPFKNISDAINNSTCQCYVKNTSEFKIQQRFSETFINKEFNTSLGYYLGIRPPIYSYNSPIITPISYKYSLYEIILIWLFSIKMLIIQFNNYRSGRSGKMTFTSKGIVDYSDKGYICGFAWDKIDLVIIGKKSTVVFSKFPFCLFVNTKDNKEIIENIKKNVDTPKIVYRKK